MASFKIIMSDGTCMRDWLSEKEQQQCEDGMGNFNGWYQLAVRRHESAKNWLMFRYTFLLPGFLFILYKVVIG